MPATLAELFLVFVIVIGRENACMLCNVKQRVRRCNFTLISAISSSFFMFCFSVTRMPCSSRIALHRGSTLSLINTVLTEIGAILELSVRVPLVLGRELVMNEWSDGGLFACLLVLYGYLRKKTAPSNVNPPLVHLLFWRKKTSSHKDTVRASAVTIPKQVLISVVNMKYKSRPSHVHWYNYGLKSRQVCL